MCWRVHCTVCLTFISACYFWAQYRPLVMFLLLQNSAFCPLVLCWMNARCCLMVGKAVKLRVTAETLWFLLSSVWMAVCCYLLYFISLPVPWCSACFYSPGTKIVVNVKMEAKNHGLVWSRNTIAEIKGSTYPDQVGTSTCTQCVKYNYYTVPSLYNPAPFVPRKSAGLGRVLD